MDTSLQTTNSNLTERNILSNLFTKCKHCSIRHNCSVHKERIKLATDEIELKKNKIAEAKSRKPDDSGWNKEKDKELFDFIMLVWKKYDESLGEHDCTYERQEIIEDVTLLQSKYNFSDPRVFIIVKQHLRHAVLDFRAFKDSSRQSLITYRYAEDGSKIPIINPLLNYKHSSGRFIVDLIKTLDTISKEDELLDDIKTSGSGFFTKYLSKIPHNTDKIIDIDTK